MSFRDPFEAASAYVTAILERMTTSWSEIRARLAEAYARHPGLAEDDANFAEAALAAMAVGMQTLDRTADAALIERLRAALPAVVAKQFGTEEAAQALTLYEELWQRTRDPRGFGLGFIMRVLGEDPSRISSTTDLIRYKTEKVVGGALIDAAVGVWGKVLQGE